VNYESKEQREREREREKGEESDLGDKDIQN
jgi:hypothetical protein